MPIALMLAVVLSATSGASGQREWQRYQVIRERLHLDKFAALPEADLFRAVEQANRFIRGQAGVLGFAAPRMKGIVLHFAERDAQTVRLSGSGVNESYSTD